MIVIFTVAVVCVRTMIESLRNESTKLDDLMNLTVNVSQKQNEIEKMKPQLSKQNFDNDRIS
jgi:hypothetical protein